MKYLVKISNIQITVEDATMIIYSLNEDASLSYTEQYIEDGLYEIRHNRDYLADILLDNEFFEKLKSNASSKLQAMIEGNCQKLATTKNIVQNVCIKRTSETSCDITFELHTNLDKNVVENEIETQFCYDMSHYFEDEFVLFPVIVESLAYLEYVTFEVILDTKRMETATCEIIE